MDVRLLPLAETLRLNTRLFLNCLEGVDDGLALRRVSDRTNHIAFLAAHLVGARAYFAGLLGGDGADPFEDRLGGARTIDDVDEWPEMEEIRAAWPEVTERLLERLDAVGTDELDQPLDSRFPSETRTVFGAATFLVQHDTYHIGQLAILRKHFGLGAMSYD